MSISRPLFTLKNSPFTKERNLKNKDKTIGVRVPEDVHQDISNYFEGIYGENSMSKGINDLLVKTLDNVCTERTIYNNISIFMLIPKTDDINVLSENSIIFALVDERNDFNTFNTTPLDDIVYELPFIKGILSDDFSQLPIDFLLDVENHCFVDMNIEDIDEKDDFLELLANTFAIDLNEYYWTHLKLNNYLDGYRDGQYQAQLYNNEHLGVYIMNTLIDLEDTEKLKVLLFMTIKWRYFNDIESIDLNPQFFKERELLSYISDVKDKELSSKAFKIVYGEDTKEYLVNMRKSLVEDLNTVKRLIKSIDEKLENEFPEE